MRRKGAITARFIILYEILRFLVTICLSVSYVFLSRFGTECAYIVGEHESKPLLVSDATAQRPTGRLSIHPIRGGNNEPLLSTSALACLDNGSLSCCAGRAIVKVEKVCSHEPAQVRDLRPGHAKPRRHLPLSAAVPSRAMTTPLPASLRATHQEALSRRPWRHHLVR